MRGADVRARGVACQAGQLPLADRRQQVLILLPTGALGAEYP